MFVDNNGYGQTSLRRLLQMCVFLITVSWDVIFNREFSDFDNRYASLDPEVGYCQGMAFVAALFLTYMPEDHAFYCLYATLMVSNSPGPTQWYYFLILNNCCGCALFLCVLHAARFRSASLVIFAQDGRDPENAVCVWRLGCPTSGSLVDAFAEPRTSSDHVRTVVVL